MAHAIWSGSINFGLVTIPVKLLSAVRSGSDIHFHLLHAKDEGRIHNDRVCDVCGQKVAWQDLVRGFEYEKGQYVVITDEDLKKVSVEATQSVDIVEFVDLAEIDPMFFDTPYYLEPEKKGRHAYALLREALSRSGKVGIARVVLRSREHLAALRPVGDALVIELMHWQDELVDKSTLDLPETKEDMPAPEMKAAAMLIDAMTKRFDPGEFHDRYREAVLKMIEARAQGKPAPKAGRQKHAPNVLNLMDVLQRSLDEAARDKGEKGEKPRAKGPAKARARHHAKKTAA